MYCMAIEGLGCEYGSTTSSPNSSDSTPPYLGDFKGLLPPHEPSCSIVSFDVGQSLEMVTGLAGLSPDGADRPLTLETSWLSGIVPATNALLLDTCLLYTSDAADE